MRVFLGLLVLTTLFLMAAFWQQGITRRLEEKREHEQGLSVLAADGEDRWVKLVLGRPSGADPMPSPIQLQSTPTWPPEGDPGSEPNRPPVEPANSNDPSGANPEPSIVPDVTYVVKPGDVLGTICQERYGTARPKVLDAVATYNELTDPDALKLGQVLALPSLSVLFPEGLE